MQPRTRLDEYVPEWHFHEIHSTSVRASPARIYQAIREVTASEILFFRTLTWLRRLGRPGPESILNPPSSVPLLDVATRTSFFVLTEEELREIVVGTLVISPPSRPLPEHVTPEAFKSLSTPGFAKAAISFAIAEDRTGRCRLTTETRVYATDPRTRRRFAAYWRMIYPGSSFIRRMWLRAIRLRAEAPALVDAG